MKNICTILLLVICLFCLSCKKKRKPDPEPIIPDIYLAGGSSVNEVSTAQYWKNGKAVNLATTEELPGALSIVVSGSDVHVLGQASKNRIALGQYWKNGLLTDFKKNLLSTFVYDIAVSGSDIYIAGYGQKALNSNNYATYWKNGEAVIYDNAINGGAQGIFLSGNDVYIAGNAWNGNFAVAKYWKNGIRVNLGKETTTSYAMAIAVSGSGVHVVGWGGDNLGPKYAKYWKNGVEVPLTDFTEDYSEATDVAISGSDVYIVGRVRKGVVSEAKIWKNGVPNPLPSGGSASSIFVFNNDIYITGRANGTPFEKAVYWKNGTPTFISDGTKNVWVTSVFVKNP